MVVRRSSVMAAVAAVTTLSLVAYCYRKRIIQALHARTTPYNQHIAKWKRDATVVGLMHLCGNKPKIEVT